MAIDWLADFLTDPRRAKRLSLLLVTHDRYFLERTCSEIVELDSAAVYTYRTDGSYQTFLRRREERLAADDADLSREQERLKREAAWDAKQPKARQAKSKSRSAAFADLKEANAQRMQDRAVSAATAGRRRPWARRRRRRRARRAAGGGSRAEARRLPRSGGWATRW